MGEKARCSRSVKNTFKHPARECHIDIMQVNPILGHFGTLKAKKWAIFLQIVIFPHWYIVRCSNSTPVWYASRLYRAHFYPKTTKVSKYFFIKSLFTWWRKNEMMQWNHLNYSSSRKRLSTKVSISVLIITFGFLLFTSRSISTIVGLLLYRGE